MSADTEIETLLTNATQQASSLASSSEALVQSAMATLANALSFADPPTTIRSAPKAPTVTPNEEEINAVFPPWPITTFPTAPSLQQLEVVKAEITTEFPDLSIPVLPLTTLPSLGAFSAAEPNSQTIPLPPVPNIDPTVPTPTPLPLAELPTVHLELPSANFAAVDTDLSFASPFSGAFSYFKEMPLLLSALTELDQDCARRLDALLPTALQALAPIFAEPLTLALPFQATLQAALDRRLLEEQQRAASALADRSGWELPYATQQALLSTQQQLAASDAQLARAQVMAHAEELALSFHEAVGSLFSALSDAIQQLRAQEVEALLDAYRFAATYARQTLAGLLAEFEATNLIRQEGMADADDARLRVVEAELEVAMTRFEVAKADLQVEQTRQDNDAALIADYQTAVRTAGKEVEIYAAEVSAARRELALKRRPFELFALQAKAFSARVGAQEAQISALVASVENNEAKQEVELLKVKAYEEQAADFESVIATKASLVHAQSDRNEAVIQEFSSKIKGALGVASESVMENQYALLKYQATAENTLADARVALKAAAMEQEFQDRAQDGVLQAYQFTQERNVEQLRAELDRLKAIAETRDQSAKILETMAQGALSAANGVAAAIFSETA